MDSANYENLFGDKRLEKRGAQLSKRIFQSGKRSIQSFALSPAERKAFYRILRNNKVSEDLLINELSARCSRTVKGKIVLAIQDTTEINLSNHYNRLDKDSGLGKLDGPYEKHIGFKVHPSLVIDAFNGFPLGFAKIKIWNRSQDATTKHDRAYGNLPITEKESFKWIETSQHTQKHLQEAAATIIVQDREGDIFDQFVEIADDKTFLLIRSQVNRALDNRSKLWDTLAAANVAGNCVVYIDADSHSQEAAREASMEVRFIKATIKAPKTKVKLKDQVVYAVETKEINSTAKEPIIWRLVTTWPVNNFYDASLIIQWYKSRWVIEEVFRLLKKGGFNIEGSELENGWALRKLCIMLMDSVLKILQMHIAYNMPEEQGPGIDTCFEIDQQQLLMVLNKKLEGKTAALQNPNVPSSLSWAAWIMARLGGWMGYKSQRPPGLTTFLRGLEKFYSTWDSIQLMGTR